MCRRIQNGISHLLALCFTCKQLSRSRDSISILMVNSETFSMSILWLLFYNTQCKLEAMTGNIIQKWPCNSYSLSIDMSTLLYWRLISAPWLVAWFTPLHTSKVVVIFSLKLTMAWFPNIHHRMLDMKLLRNVEMYAMETFNWSQWAPTARDSTGQPPCHWSLTSSHVSGHFPDRDDLHLTLALSK